MPGTLHWSISPPPDEPAASSASERKHGIVECADFKSAKLRCFCENEHLYKSCQVLKIRNAVSFVALQFSNSIALDFLSDYCCCYIPIASSHDGGRSRALCGGMAEGPYPHSSSFQLPDPLPFQAEEMQGGRFVFHGTVEEQRAQFAGFIESIRPFLPPPSEKIKIGEPLSGTFQRKRMLIQMQSTPWSRRAGRKSGSTSPSVLKAPSRSACSTCPLH